MSDDSVRKDYYKWVPVPEVNATLQILEYNGVKLLAIVQEKNGDKYLVLDITQPPEVRVLWEGLSESTAKRLAEVSLELLLEQCLL